MNILNIRFEDEKLLEERLKAQREQMKYEHEMLRHAEITQVFPRVSISEKNLRA